MKLDKINISTITKKFKKYKLKMSNEKMEDICKPASFKFQPQQLFLRDYFKSSLSGKGLLVYHKIGAGKTCTAITIAEQFKHKMNLVVVLPAALIGNFKDDLPSGKAVIKNKSGKIIFDGEFIEK
jgi:superfamily II DNA or RNA helicase